MKFVVKLFPEIIVKSKPVRKQLIAQLKKNLRKLFSKIDGSIQVHGSWDHVEVTLGSDDPELGALVLDKLTHTPGIDFVLQVKSHAFETIADIEKIVATEYQDKVSGKTFCVRAKRTGKHPFSSTQVEQACGGALLETGKPKGVSLKDPQFTVSIEVKQDIVNTIESRSKGLGGYPLGQQESCLSLISGGFDSSVASYLMMRRGIRTHFLFFNLGGMAHEVGVKQVAHYLWEKYAQSHRVLFISIPFEEVVNEILTKVHHSQMGVILKRMMMRVAEQIANEFSIPGVVTGECVGQVSSQTMTNLSVIDQATSILAMRPLITMDKQEIIGLARKTGTEAFAAAMPEYCGVISDKPTTRAKLNKIEHEESQFDFDILQEAFENRKVESIEQIYKAQSNIDNIEIVSTPNATDEIIDIRHPDEVQNKPLVLTNNKIQTIPFFKLSNTQGLNKEISYLLYCDKGIMSQLQAESLLEKGYRVKVYQPK